MTGTSSPSPVGPGPGDGAGGGEGEAGTAGGVSAAFVPPLEAALQARPAPSAGPQLGPSLAGPNSCGQRHLGASGTECPGKEVVPGVGGPSSPCILLQDPFCWGVSGVRRGPGVKLGETVFTAGARLLLPSAPFLGLAGLGGC